jgi:hypothetical protein
MSLIETIDLRYVKEEADFGTGSALECRFAFSLGEVLNKRWCEQAFAATTREKPVSRFAKLNGTSKARSTVFGCGNTICAEIILPVVISAQRSANILSAGRLIER